MELRGQDKRSIASSTTAASGIGIPSNFSYGFTSVISATGVVGVAGGDQRRREETGNGALSNALNSSQTLDNQFHNLLHQQNHNRPSSSSISPQLPDPDPNPNPPAPDPDPAPTVRYKECLKNHAASIGGHVIDGCGEFMPSSEEALKCAACDCHRSFHRKEIEGESSQSKTVTKCYFCYNKTDTKTRTLPPPPLPPSTIQHHHKFTSKFPGRNQPMMMTFGSGGGTDQSSSEEFNVGSGHHHQHPSSSSSKKRFRTKFSQEQKEKMSEFAEKIGWRFGKEDEEEVQRFCVDVGVKKQVLKVWMHNNKQKKKLDDEEL